MRGFVTAIVLVGASLVSGLPAGAQIDAAERMRTAASDNRIEQVRVALDAGVSPNAADANGYTALMWAAEHNRPEIAALLLSRGARPELKNKYGGTAATMGRHYPAIQALLEGAAGNVRGATAAATPGRPAPGRPASRLEGGGAGEALLQAAVARNPAQVQALLRSGADPNFQDAQGYTALMRSTSNGDLESVRALLKAGANPNLRNENGFAAVTYARTPEAEALLRAAGAKPPPKSATPKPGEVNYCRAMYTRTYSLCDASSYSCKASAAQKWATCNKTGRWPS